jgi:hypothetical protein
VPPFQKTRKGSNYTGATPNPRALAMEEPPAGPASADAAELVFAPRIGREQLADYLQAAAAAWPSATTARGAARMRSANGPSARVADGAELSAEAQEARAHTRKAQRAAVQPAHLPHLGMAPA